MKRFSLNEINSGAHTSNRQVSHVPVNADDYCVKSDKWPSSSLHRHRLNGPVMLYIWFSISFTVPPLCVHSLCLPHSRNSFIHVVCHILLSLMPCIFLTNAIWIFVVDEAIHRQQHLQSCKWVSKYSSQYFHFVLWVLWNDLSLHDSSFSCLIPSIQVETDIMRFRCRQ